MEEERKRKGEEPFGILHDRGEREVDLHLSAAAVFSSSETMLLRGFGKQPLRFPLSLAEPSLEGRRVLALFHAVDVVLIQAAIQKAGVVSVGLGQTGILQRTRATMCRSYNLI